MQSLPSAPALPPRSPRSSSSLRSCVSVAALCSSSCVWLKSCINHHTLIYLNVDFSTLYALYALLLYTFFLWGLQVISHSRKACYTFFSRSARSCFSLTFRCQITVVICVCYVCMRVWACVCVFVYVCVCWSVFFFFFKC